ncbi:uncharacterized protein PAC_14378 [Phialocephala subalpina]|uniref:F-box domain-containing protein n=1 Tax=Phialocephala subalpina TaxID=576137 RepID=A0A1L7XHH0_9HELO|nr:uncharacterized protein PAC_14378 [Phialocephala subalpina]
MADIPTADTDQSVHTELILGTLSLSESETAETCDGENEKELQRQVNQATSLLKKLPFDIHYLIFENLGPASRRILGAACSSFYDIYKSHFYNKQIAVHYNEASSAERGLPDTRRFYNILTNWLIPREGIVTKEEAEQTRMMQSYWPFMNLPTKQKRDKSYWLGWILDQHKDEGHGMWLLYRKRNAKMKISAPIQIPYGGKAVLELYGRPILPVKKRVKKSTRAF